MDWFNSVTISALNKNLDGLWARERTISENIANYETPGYKSKYVTFENALLSAIGKGQDEFDTVDHIQRVDIIEQVSDAESLREDGNNVDLESENIELARTQLNYSYTVQSLNDYLARLRTAINGS